MASSTTLQIRKADLIAKLKSRKAEFIKDLEAHNTAKEAYDKAITEWTAKVISNPDNIKSVKINAYAQLDVVLVDKALKSRPVWKDPLKNKAWSHYNLEGMIEGVTSSLQLFEMVEGDTVPMRYYEDVRRYL